MKDYLRMFPFANALHCLVDERRRDVKHLPGVSWVTWMMQQRPKPSPSVRRLDAEEAVKSAQRHLKTERAAHRAAVMEAQRGLAKDRRREMRMRLVGRAS